MIELQNSYFNHPNPNSNDNNPMLSPDIDQFELNRHLDDSSFSLNSTNNVQSQLEIVTHKICNLKFYSFFFLFTTIIMTILWLSESQFSQGVLRYKYLGESCQWSITNNKICAPPLICQNNKCQLIQKNCIDNSNCTGLINPQECPQCKSCPPCQNLVSYFDFNEFPNYWLPRQRNFGKTEILLGMSYGACKEVCARDPKCKLICFNGIRNICHKRIGYLFPGVQNMTWTCAIKTNNLK